MGVKIFVIFVCAAIGTATGFAVMRSYKRRLSYMEGMCALIAELKRNILYRRDSASAVLSSFRTENAQLKKNVEEYLAFAAAKDGTLEVTRGYLSADAHDVAVGLFSALGSPDGSAQLAELDMYAEKFGLLRDVAADRSQKMGAVAVKLGFLVGVGVGVLFL